MHNPLKIYDPFFQIPDLPAIHRYFYTVHRNMLTEPKRYAIIEVHRMNLCCEGLQKWSEITAAWATIEPKGCGCCIPTAPLTESGVPKEA